MKTQVRILILLVTVLEVISKDLYEDRNEVMNEEVDLLVEEDSLHRQIRSVSESDRRRPTKAKKPTNNWLVLTGGEISDGTYLDNSEIVSYLGVCPNPATIPQLAAQTSKGQSLWVDGKLLFCGGAQTGQKANNKCFSLKPGEADWASEDDMTSHRALYSLTIMNNDPDQVLAVGGVDENDICVNTMEKRNFKYTEWKTLPYKITYKSEDFPTCGQCAVRLGKNRVMIIGGASALNDDTAITGRVWKIVVGGKTRRINKNVTPLQALPEPLWRPACIRRGGFVYVSGGKLNDGTVSAKVYKYNIAKNTWKDEEIGQLETARYGHVMGYTAGKPGAEQVVVAGGFDGSAYLDSIEDSYDLGENWITRTNHNLEEGKKESAMAMVPAYSFNCDQKA